MPCVPLSGESADGISALSPIDYAERFYTFALYEVLLLPQPPGQAEAEQQYARDGCCSLFRAPLRAGGGRGSLQSNLRWGKLWQRRRRGLVCASALR